MEALETRILAKLGIADPYAATVPMDARRMSETERAAPVAADQSAPREPPAGLFDRLRALFGLGPASVRDDIEDALVGAGADADFTAAGAGHPEECARRCTMCGSTM